MFFSILKLKGGYTYEKIYKRPLSLVLSFLMVFSAITFLFINADVYVVAAQTETNEKVSEKVIGDADGNGGSSMGGLISYYIGMKYTDVFGQVLSFSPAFWMYSEDTIASVVDSYDYSNTDNLPKVFLYVGGANQMEKDTIPYVDLVYNKMSENGYPEDKLNTLTDTTKDHNEAAWSEYFPQAYKWLVGFNA